MIFRRSIATLHGKTALVTGGSRGIGLRIAKELSSRGVNIVLLARNKDLLKHNLKHELHQIDNSQQHSYLACDLQNVDSIHETFHSSTDLKNVSIVINAAGIHQNSLLYSTTPVKVSNMVNTNLTGTILVSQLMLRALLTNRPASIINFSSVLANRALKGTSVYSATKAGIIGFTKALALEMGPKQIRVNSISPGLIKETEMGKDFHFDNVLQKESVDIDDVVRGVVYLLESESVTGENLVIDNGYLLL